MISNKTPDFSGMNATSSKLRGGVKNKKTITVPFTKGDKGANKNERRRGIKITNDGNISPPPYGAPPL